MALRYEVKNQGMMVKTIFTMLVFLEVLMVVLATPVLAAKPCPAQSQRGRNERSWDRSLLLLCVYRAANE
jgi:hypothetical protein